MKSLADFVLLCLYVIEGGVVGVFNALVVILILTDKNLRRQNELLFITGLCIGDGIDGVGYFIAGVMRVRNILLETDSDLTPASSCLYTSYITLFFYGYAVPPLMMISVSIDRLIAVFFPVRHGSIQTSSRLIVMFCMFGWATVAFVATRYLTSLDSDRLIRKQCLSDEVYGPQIWGYIIAQRCCLIYVCVIIYVPIFVKTREIMKRNEGNPRNQRFNITMIYIVVSALFFLAIPDTLCFLTILGVGNLTEYQLLFYTISINKGLVNMFVYTLRQRDLKKRVITVARRAFCIWKTTPSSSTTNNTTVDVGNRI